MPQWVFQLAVFYCILVLLWFAFGMLLMAEVVSRSTFLLSRYNIESTFETMRRERAWQVVAVEVTTCLAFFYINIPVALYQRYVKKNTVLAVWKGILMETPTLEILIERVKRGFTLLDKKSENWRARFAINRLSVISFDDCALGMLYGSYERGLREVGLDETNAYEYGFDLCPLEYNRNADREATPWPSLQHAWEQVWQESLEGAL